MGARGREYYLRHLSLDEGGRLMDRLLRSVADRGSIDGRAAGIAMSDGSRIAFMRSTPPRSARARFRQPARRRILEAIAEEVVRAE